ncbi:rhombosortase [Shewanella holmiensis]|uniref:Rhombosortase n=1 Tax=Shewanella holmiensis TaxID=2952222 RepID=A0A9X2WP72_9GAMM|nr:rhombosortase [Shewanella holmiensis]MCT7942997.1 rhombosortase [Shewanella holmiensis]
MAKAPLSTVKPNHFTLIISLICLVLFALTLTSPMIIDTNSIFKFEHDAIANGQIWRIVTGNLLHTNAWHLVMNLAGLWVIVFLHELHYKRHTPKLILLFISLCILEGIGLYVFYPELKAYVGLSGVLHGLFTFGAVMDIRKGLRSGYLLLLGVVAKVAYEQYFGASAGITELINARVATESHLVGVFAGLICALFWSTVAYRFKYRK